MQQADQMEEPLGHANNLSIHAVIICFDHSEQQAILAELKQKTFESCFNIDVILAQDGDAYLQQQRDQLVVVPFYVMDQWSKEFEDILRAYQRDWGGFRELQFLVCSQPSFSFLNMIFDYQIDKVLARDSLAHTLDVYLKQVLALINRDVCLVRAMEMLQSLRLDHHDKTNEMIAKAKARAQASAELSYAKGRAFANLGSFAPATQSFFEAYRLSPLSRSFALDAAEHALILGKIKEALILLRQLSRQSSQNLYIRSMLVSALLEAEDAESAKEEIAAINALDAKHPAAAEAKVLMHLSENDFDKALALISQISHAGPLLAARLNDVGIRLSKEGQGGLALQLYALARDIVRKDLRYKISLNAALAAYRMHDYQQALKLADQAQKDYGKEFPKLKKVRKAILHALSQTKGAA